MPNLFMQPSHADDESSWNRRTMATGRRSALLRLLPLAAAFLVMARAAARPAFADEFGASRAELIQNLLPTVVNISVLKQEAADPAAAATAGAAAPAVDAGPNVKGFVGSGFVIDPSGVVVTNYHVVQDAFEITVMFSDGTRLPGKTMSASRLADLALVKVEADHPLPAAHWGNSDRLHVGDQVFAAGNPFGLGLSVSAGIVSGLNRDIQNSPYDDLIQTDATINHGNSGGPLFDMQGNVIGVDSVLISPTTGSVGLGFAIPSSSAEFVVGQLRTYGWVRPGWIGVKMQQVTPDIAAAMGGVRPEGSLVAWVLPGGPANRAGLQIGDVILGYDGIVPTDERALLRDIVHTPAGKTVPLLVRRDGEERTLPVTVDAWPRNQWDTRDAPTLTQRPKFTIPPDLGLSLSALAAEDKPKLGLANDLSGVLVTSVAPGSDSAHRGMTTGDVILRVQDKSVTTPAEVLSAIDAARGTKREFVLMLVLPKLGEVPGPKWVPLELGTAGG